MKKLLILVLLGLPIIWWVRDPQSAKQKTAQALRFIETKTGDAAERLDPTGNVARQSNYPVGDEKVSRNVREAAIPELPPNVYLLKQDVAAKPQPVPGMLAKGSQVKLIGEAGERKLITDGTREAMVDAGLITREPDEIPALMQVAKENRDAQTAKRREELKGNLAKIESKIESVQTELSAIRVRDSQAREAGKKGAQFGTQEEFLLSEIRRQEGFRDAVLKQLKALD